VTLVGDDEWKNESHGVVLFSLKPPSLLLGYLNPSTHLPSTPLLPSPQDQELPLPTPHHLTPQTSSFKDISTPPPFHPSCSEDTSTLPPIQPSFSTPLLPSSPPPILLLSCTSCGNPCSLCGETCYSCGYPYCPMATLAPTVATPLPLWRPCSSCGDSCSCG